MFIEVTSRRNEPVILSLLDYAVFSDPDGLESAVKEYGEGDNRHLYVFEDEGQYVGIIGFEIDTKGTKSESTVLRIKHLAVRPEDRMKEYGRRLIIEALLAVSPDVVVADTDEEGAEFFRNIGFQVSGHLSPDGGYEQFCCVYEVNEEEDEQDE